MQLLIFLFALTVSWNIPFILTDYTNNGIVSLLISPVDDPIETGRVKRDAAIPGNIDQMNVTTKVTNRFATTTISSRLKNDEVTFSTVLPVDAFISRFWMEIGDTTYEAEIKEKNNASRIYNEAVSEGRTAGHVELSVRDSKRLMVSVNVQPKKTVIFHLTYEELLTRKNNKYEIGANFFRANSVNELNIMVSINDTMPLVFIGTPLLKIHSDLTEFIEEHEEPTIEIINTNAAKVAFSVDVWKSRKNQNFFSHHRMGAEFTMQYDVIRNNEGDQVLIGKDHFVHFFAPTLPVSLPKQMIFVLDMSSSMTGLKLENLKKVMRNILKKLKPDDVFNVLEFSDTFTMWDIPENNRVTFEAGIYGSELKDHYVPPDVEATNGNIRKAVNMTNKLQGDGLTHLIRALEDAIYLSERNMKAENNSFQPIVMLFSDGYANVGLTETEDIVDRVLALNSGSNRAAIYCISVGEDVEKALLEKISLTNQGRFRQIHDELDSDVQLQEFLNEITSPMLKKLTFAYGSGSVKDVTNTEFPMYFFGGEIAIAGVIDENQKENFNPTVKALGKGNALFELHSGYLTVGEDFERHFAFLKLKQKIELMKVSPNATEIAEEVLAMSLQYSVFTPVMSMSIVKPDGTIIIRDNYILE